MTGIPDLGIRADIMGRVLDPLMCVFLTGIQSVGIGACMHVCVWYTELTSLMEIKGFSQCIAANKQQTCGLAAAAGCGMVAACEFSNAN